jgi:DNA-binding transcriptional LysR family regulator
MHCVHINSFDLNLLVSLEALLEEGTVSRAASRVGVSQPAMSRTLGRLRAVFEDPLIVRQGKRTSLTPRAQQLRQPVRDALDRVRGILREREAFEPSESRRTFTIATTDYFELMLAGPVLARLREEAPGIVLRLVRLESLFGLPEAELTEGRCDLALGFSFDQIPAHLALFRETAGEQQNVCIVSANHPRLRGKRIEMDEFATEHHVAVFYRREGPGLLDRILAMSGYERKIAMIVPHFTTVCHLVAASDLIAVVPEQLARFYAATLPLRVFALPYQMPPFVTSMIWHERSQNDPGLEWLRRRLTEAFAPGE